LGYRSSGPDRPVFGIYHRKLAERIQSMTDLSHQKLEQMLAECGKLLPLPDQSTTPESI
jgi:hypothetical protein